MITKIQHQTASLAICNFIIPAKDYKTKSTPTTRRATDQKSHDEWRVCVCLHGTGLCVSSQLSSPPQLGLCVFSFPPGRLKAAAPMFQHNGGAVAHVKDGKYASLEKNVNSKRQGWNVFVDGRPGDRCFQLFHKRKSDIS